LLAAGSVGCAFAVCLSQFIFSELVCGKRFPEQADSNRVRSREVGTLACRGGN
jgi:hypothetical protein